MSSSTKPPFSLLLFVAWVFFTGMLAAQPGKQEITISGTVSDAQSGETLIGATVLCEETGTGTSTNEYGFYAFKLPASADSLTLDFSYVGYQARRVRIKANSDQRLDVQLGTGVQLQEVVVQANSYREQLRSTEMSVEELDTREVKVLPALLGESDILKTIQLKPGIPSGSEGTTGLYVRGGSADQNLIVLDEAVVYNANHLFGFFSTFNTDAVKDLKLYKGGFPAQYGGRLSSVIDVRMKEGNNRSFHGTGGIGLITSRLTLEGPIQKEKSSFIVSGRRTYADIITRQINKANEDDPDYNPIPDYYFYDLNTKVNFTLGENDRLFLSGYFGRDVFGFSGDFFDFSFNWGNATGTVRWNHVFSNRLFHNLTFTWSDYEYNIETKVTGFSFKVGSDVRDANLKSDFYYSLDSRNTLRFGGNATAHQFGVGRLKAGSDDGTVSFSGGSDFDALSLGAYFSDELSLGDFWKVNAGVRLSGFINDGKTYFGLEPRISALYTLTPDVSIKGSYARMYQYLHLVSTSGIALPTDIWYPSTRTIRPQNADQVALGYEYLWNNRLLLTHEFYYKRLRHQVDFVDGARLFANENLEQEFAIGKGYAYGMELGIEKREGALKGWLGYTLALVRRTGFKPVDETRTFSGEGNPYFPRYDRRHDLSLVLMYDVSRRLTLSATMVYGSGDRTWMPVGRFSFQDVYGADFQPIVPIFGERNAFRLPYFFRADAAIVYRFFPRWGESDLTLSIFNLTNRRNAFFIYLEPQYPDGVDPLTDPLAIPTGIKAKQVSLFPILGSLTWNFRF
ncbi:MAG: TonB-dependent receptor [Saprospiraceae bacterium]|nr:MAG: TonB-dependent receptor [Saprospiraceae bacterium]